MPAATTLEEVVEVLNVLGATPRDMISILTTMSESGMLVAEIRRM
ncbi:MAG: flagellar basal body P-ring protein FlgI [Planctomycetota bacterium]|nr:flagellar basal body P-ring protein FlgI [Planctomycetota bacterium]